ncbi:hypothetical protein SAMN05421538_10752 [Paracoccus isoporae]|uniref:Uncharacterized protein n=1 Tax=Paracoccus isoporae TaxID=591205 RepID=A0A1G7DBU7_9RHOB|nr:hypothetical protein [Paracoccus isoporae]SDE49041.1 hypothetical protein SAMN05421538_10752 [Paracoccus isoporae]
MQRFLCRLAAVLVVLLPAAGSAAEEFPTDGPFVKGEAFPETPATCDSLPGWMDQLPEHDGRISMAVTGPLLASDWDGALAYLIVCPADQTQVICVTYEPLEVAEGRQVTLAGGFAGSRQGQVLLDPCLATPAAP